MQFVAPGDYLTVANWQLNISVIFHGMFRIFYWCFELFICFMNPPETPVEKHWRDM